MKIKLAVLLLALSSILNAQENYMSLSFGSSIPFGDYAATNDLLKNGFAQSGFMANYNGVYFFSDYIGFHGNVKFCSNVINKELAGEKLLDLLPPDFPSDSISEFSIKDTWNHVSFLVGPQFTLPLGKFSMDAYATAGLCIMMGPTMNITARKDNQLNSYSYTNTTTSFAYSAGLSFRYQLNDDYGLIVFGDYFHAKANRTGLEQIDGGQIVETTYSMPVQIANLGIGISFRL